MTDEEIDALSLGSPAKSIAGDHNEVAWYEINGMGHAYDARIRRTNTNQWEFSVYNQGTDITHQKERYPSPDEALAGLKEWLKRLFSGS